MKIFLDTSALIAYYNAGDRYHREAADTMEKIKAGEIPFTRFYLSDYIFDEAVTFIEMVLERHELAKEVGEALLSSPFTSIVAIDEETFQHAWNRFKTAQGVSFTDCTSFSTIEKYGITQVFTFDRHFREAGFNTIPPRTS